MLKNLLLITLVCTHAYANDGALESGSGGISPAGPPISNVAAPAASAASNAATNVPNIDSDDEFIGAIVRGDEPRYTRRSYNEWPDPCDDECYEKGCLICGPLIILSPIIAWLLCRP